MRRTIIVWLLFALCTALASYFYRIIRALSEIEYEPPLVKDDIETFAKITAHVTLVATGEELTRHLLSRLGASVGLHVIVIAAAPLDYLLAQLFPGWDLIVYSKCHSKRSIPGMFGGCAHARAYACYQYSARPPGDSWNMWQTDASGSVDFQNMATCYAQQKISVREARLHFQECHWQSPGRHEITAWACTANIARNIAFQKQSCDLAQVAVRCADRFGLRDDVVKSMQASDMFNVTIEPCADNNEATCFGMVPLVFTSTLED